MSELIRYKKIVSGVRLGGNEPKRIIAETEQYVIYKVSSNKGKDLGEHCISRDEFNESFERIPDAPYTVEFDERVDGWLVRGHWQALIAYADEDTANLAADFLNNLAEKEAE